MPGRELHERIRFVISPSESGLPSLSSAALQCAAGAISVISPNGGEILRAGSQKEIKWSAWDYERAYPMKIEYSLDRGETWAMISKQAENSGRYIWTLPFGPKVSTRTGVVRVCDGYDGGVCDEWDGVFTIR